METSGHTGFHFDISLVLCLLQNVLNIYYYVLSFISKFSTSKTVLATSCSSCKGKDVIGSFLVRISFSNQKFCLILPYLTYCVRSSFSTSVKGNTCSAVRSDSSTVFCPQDKKASEIRFPRSSSLIPYFILSISTST